MAGFQYLDDNEVINIKLSGYGGGYILAKHSQLSFSFLTQKIIERYYVVNKATYFVVGDSKKYFDQPISWSQKLDNKLPSATKNLTFKDAGVYMVTVNVVVVTDSKDLEVKVLANDNKRLSTRKRYLDSKISRTVTLSFTGILILRRGKATVEVNIKSNSKTTIDESSTVSVAFMSANYLKYPLVALTVKKKAVYQSWRVHDWQHLQDFTLEGLSKFFFEDEHTVIPMYTGYYLMSCNMILILKKTR